MERATAAEAITVLLEAAVAMGRLAAQQGDAEQTQAKAATRAEAQSLLATMQTSLDPATRAAARQQGDGMMLAELAAWRRQQSEAGKNP